MVQENKNLRQLRLSTQIGLVARQWRRAVDQRLQPFDLTEATWMPLVHLAREHRPIQQKDLAATLSLDRSAVVCVLKYLESLGLVERQQDPDDGCAYELAATTRGREPVRQVESVSDSLELELLSAMPVAYVAAARRVIGQLSSLLLNLNTKPNARL